MTAPHADRDRTEPPFSSFLDRDPSRPVDMPIEPVDLRPVIVRLDNDIRVLVRAFQLDEGDTGRAFWPGNVDGAASDSETGGNRATDDAAPATVHDSPDKDRIDRYADAVVKGLVPWLRNVFSAVEDPEQRKVAMEVIDCIDPLMRWDGQVAPLLAVADAEQANLRADRDEWQRTARGARREFVETLDLLERAEVRLAEERAKVAPVVGLLDWLEEMHDGCTPGASGCSGCETLGKVAAVRAALASPAEPETTEGGAQ